MACRAVHGRVQRDLTVSIVYLFYSLPRCALRIQRGLTLRHTHCLFNFT